MTERAGGASERVGIVADPYDREAMLAEVLAGLRQPDKRIPSKYHYDETGSELFERITGLDEYYLTRAERALLARWMPVWVEELAPAALVELGPGGADKSRIILDAIVGRVPEALYVPVDVSGDFLHAVADQLRTEYPGLQVEPEVADMTGDLTIAHELPERAWIALLGSTLGNFAPAGAVRLLRRIAAKLRATDRFLLGVDLRPGAGKGLERVELAYNDPAGITEEFSRNLLRVLNRELGADFEPDAFRYVSFYHEEEGRIETYQESLRDQVVRFGDGSEVELREGERIRTEMSAKYDRPTIDALFAEAGLVVDRWVEDERGDYTLVLGAAWRDTLPS
ncbi:MAG TPA: L-histidine N(alpha)-methyltransferase [Longimicrobiales bacterium]|nr:L-histidine N(alpha)-methyltransferase [Longimicrobiales bacterium]